MQTGTQLAIVIPVFEDWNSTFALLNAIDASASLNSLTFSVIIVNDGGAPFPQEEVRLNKWQRIRELQILNLVCNLGHQRAIAVGLVGAAGLSNIAGVIVMDGDGEDQPEDIPRLLLAAGKQLGHIICARRSKRSEPLMFRTFYLVYKLTFLTLTGTRIDFGNFCYIPAGALGRIIHSPSTWNHLAASILRSRCPVTGVDTTRGRRIAGESRMSFTSLILHGMSAISVYADLALVRIVIATFAISGVTLFGMLAVAAERFLTKLAIPGWASNVFGSLAIILLESLVFATIAVFMLLNARSNKPVIPALDAMQFVTDRVPVVPRDLSAATKA